MTRRLPLALAALIIILAAVPASAVTIATFSVGVPEDVTLVVGTPTALTGTLINTGEQTLDFGCGTFGCTGIQVAPSVGFFYPSGQYLSFTYGTTGITSFRQQFAGLVLSPDESFDFLFGLLTLTSLPPATLDFSISLGVISSFDSAIGQGSGVINIHTPQVFVGAQASQTVAFHNLSVAQHVPDLGPMWWMTALVFAGMLVLRHR